MSSVVDSLAPFLGAFVGHPTNGNVKYRCPFHKDGKESSPAFYVHVDSGLSFCHACNKGWSLPVLLKKLGAKTWQITAASRGLEAPGKTKKRRVVESPLTFLPEELLAILGEGCPNALLDDGFDKEILRQNEIGWDPHHEVPIYPIRDHIGRLRMISGRFDDGYLFYGPHQLRPFFYEQTQYERPEKSHFLWNFHNIYPELLRGGGVDCVIVVEGFKACLWLQQLGYTNVVALMGSYLSEAQATLLERVTTTVIFFLDFDAAGREGNQRAIDRMKGSTRVKIAKYPSRLDVSKFRTTPPEEGKKIQPDYLNASGVEAALCEAQRHWSLTA